MTTSMLGRKSLLRKLKKIRKRLMKRLATGTSGTRPGQNMTHMGNDLTAPDFKMI